MDLYEYKVVPAPVRGEKARGVKTTADRFALALTQLMNALGAEGWDYVRADSLPCEERAGLTGTRSTVQNLLVFRRKLGAAPQYGWEPELTRAAPAKAAAPAAPPVAPPAAPLMGAGPIFGGAAARPATAPAAAAAAQPAEPKSAAPTLGGASRGDFVAE